MHPRSALTAIPHGLDRAVLRDHFSTRRRDVSPPTRRYSHEKLSLSSLRTFASNLFDALRLLPLPAAGPIIFHFPSGHGEN